MEQLLSVSEFGERIGKTTQTLRNWDKSGYLKPAKVGCGGHRYYTEQQVKDYLCQDDSKKHKIIIGYCRVSDAQQKNELDKQVECVRNYCIAKGYQFEIITDIGSGTDTRRKGLIALIARVSRSEVNRVVILNKDRLTKEGFSLLETIFSYLNVPIEVIDMTGR